MNWHTIEIFYKYETSLPDFLEQLFLLLVALYELPVITVHVRKWCPATGQGATGTN